MNKHVIFGDGHLRPGDDISHIHALAEFIYDERPDVIVNTGEMSDFHSLSWWDRNKKDIVNRDLKEDIRLSRKVDDLIAEPFRHYKRRLPRMIHLEANHDFRLERLRRDNAHTFGSVLARDSVAGKGWEFIPYKGDLPGYVNVDNVTYAHFFNDRTRSTYPAKWLVENYHTTCVQGHLHNFNMFGPQKTLTGQELWGIIAPAYTKQTFEYTNRLATPGVIVLEGVRDGTFEEVRFIRMSSII